MAGETTGPNLGIINGYDARDNTWRTGYEGNLRKLDAVVMLSVIEIGTETPPGAPSEGDRYILGATPTGAWAGQAGKLAVWRKATSAASAAWEFHSPATGWRADNQADGEFYRYTGSAWSAGGGASLIHAYTCTTTEAADDVVYVSAADTVEQADATDDAASRAVGWIVSKPTTTSAIVALGGRAPGSGLTPGGAVYLDPATPGGVTQTRPDVGAGEYVVFLGIADSTTTYVWQPIREEVP